MSGKFPEFWRERRSLLVGLGSVCSRDFLGRQRRIQVTRGTPLDLRKEKSIEEKTKKIGRKRKIKGPIFRLIQSEGARHVTIIP